MACLQEAIVAAIGSHVYLHGAIVAVIGRATDHCDRSRDRSRRSVAV